MRRIVEFDCLNDDLNCNKTISDGKNWTIFR